MTSNQQMSFRSPMELESISNQLVKQIISRVSTFHKLMSAQISLLQIFKEQSKLFKHLNNCDYELAYVIYTCALLLLSKIKKFVNKKNIDLYTQIEEAIDVIEPDFKSIEKVIQHNHQLLLQPTKQVDPLLDRFNNLKSSPSPEINNNQLTDINKFKYRNQITPHELRDLLNNKQQKILLIDYRPAKDFHHNHINYKHIINIEPKQLQLILKNDSSTDQDLEDLLADSLPHDQFQRFRERYKYDLVVLYNYKYGPTNQKDRFQWISDKIINDDISENPFNELIDILMIKCKYISSRLKIIPCYLSGGVLNWFNTFGKESIISSLSEDHDQSNKVNNDNKLDYLTSFGDYLTKSNHDLSVITNNESTQNDFTKYVRPATIPKTSFQPEPYRPTQPEFLKSEPITKLTMPQSNHIADNPVVVPPPVPPKNPLEQPIPRVHSSASGSMARSVSGTPNKHSGKPETPPHPKDLVVSNQDKKLRFLELHTTGLVNLGNSCYMNCILQCIAATPQLTTFFFHSINSDNGSFSITNSPYKQHININNKLGTKGLFTTSFVELLLNMFNNNEKVLNPCNFKQIMGSLSPSKQFATSDQQDCIEFLTFLLDSIHEDLNQMSYKDAQEKKLITELTPEQEKNREILPIRLASTIEWERYLKLHFSIIVDYFQGQYLSQLKCLECQSTSTTYNSFSILSLPIPEKLNKTVNVLLQDCLEEFLTLELLDDNNKWHCPNCKRFTRLTKKISITRLPQVLIINFKRFKYDGNGRFNKLETFVTYPVTKELDLTPYWPDLGTSISSNNPMTIEQEKQVLATLPVRNQIPPFKYKLFGVVNHFGNLTTGHYTSYVLKQSDKSKTRGWCYFDDAKITLNCSVDKVMNRNAYCLFFQRI